MEVILVALQLAACQPDLIHCRDLPDDQRRWVDIGDCETARKSAREDTQEHLSRHEIVLSRCRYIMSRDDRSPAMF